MKQILTRSTLAIALGLAVLSTPTYWANAANHPYSRLATVNDIEFTVNLDWDIANPPTITGKDRKSEDLTYRLDEAYVRDVLNAVARTVFTMTEGRHRVSQFYVYSNNRYGNNVDIRIINKEGRSNASAAGFNRGGLTSNNYTIQGKNKDGSNFLESKVDLGQVIAHEMGHYFYGLYDEYAQGANNGPISSPRDSDNARNTLMHNQYDFPTLSTAEDYAREGERNTAQARVYGRADGTGGSAWEMLTRAKEADGPNAANDDAARNRIVFEAFRGLNFPTQASLTKPVLQDGQLPKIDYLNPQGPKNLIVVDTSASATNFAKIIDAAKGIVGKSSADGETTIFITNVRNNTYAASGSITNNEAGKASLLQVLNGLTATPNVASNEESLTMGIAALKTARASLNEPATVTLLASDGTTFSEQIGVNARNEKISFNVVRFPEPTETTASKSGLQVSRAPSANAMKAAGSLEALARLSGGAYNTALSGAEAAKEASRELMGNEKPIAVLETDGVESLAGGERLTTTFLIGKTTVDGDAVATWYFDPADASKLSFSLRSPSGVTYTNVNPGAVTFDSDASEGYAEFIIPASLAGREGNWTGTVLANAKTSDFVEFEALSESSTELMVEFLPATSAGAATLFAKFMGDGYPVSGANVVANIYNADTGDLVQGNLVMRDSGTNGDAKANDGVYTVNLPAALSVGNFFADVVAKTDASSSFSTNVIFARGDAPASELTGLISRTGFAEFSVAQATTPPVTPTPTPTPTPASGGGGGCTSVGYGDDASLVMLLSVALFGWMFRMRRRHRALRNTV